MDESSPLDGSLFSTPAQAPVLTDWDKAYLRFETPEQEIRKFTRRLLSIGVASWPRDAAVVELFCGRGNGLHALAGLGFTRLEGIDLSPVLLARYKGGANCYVGDCRQLPFADRSRDILIVQGGLHHLPQLPSDLGKTLSEAVRVLRPNGLFVAVEPWLTPFLSVVHVLCRSTIARGMSNKLDALATMIDHERQTYERWLSRPEEILATLRTRFEILRCDTRLGKLFFVGRNGPRGRDAA